MSTTIPGFRIAYSTKQSFDVYEIFDEVSEGFCSYEIGDVTITHYHPGCVRVVSSKGLSFCYYPEALERTLEREGVLEP